MYLIKPIKMAWNAPFTFISSYDDHPNIYIMITNKIISISYLRCDDHKKENDNLVY